MKIAITAAVLFLLAFGANGQTSQAPEKAEKILTANDVIEQIKAHVGVPWQEPTVDTFKAGDPQSHVTGVAVTMMATLDVLKRAAANGQNLIITHEPTFYDHMDNPAQLPQGEDDAVLKEKRGFIAEHHLVIWRFHDYWHRCKTGWDRSRERARAGLGKISGPGKSIFIHDSGNDGGETSGRVAREIERSGAAHCGRS